jgi:hypothetical protein
MSEMHLSLLQLQTESEDFCAVAFASPAETTGIDFTASTTAGCVGAISLYPSVDASLLRISSVPPRCHVGREMLIELSLSSDDELPRQRSMLDYVVAHVWFRAYFVLPDDVRRVPLSSSFCISPFSSHVTISTQVPLDSAAGSSIYVAAAYIGGEKIASAALPAKVPVCDLIGRHAPAAKLPGTVFPRAQSHQLLHVSSDGHVYVLRAGAVEVYTASGQFEKEATIDATSLGVASFSIGSFIVDTDSDSLVLFDRCKVVAVALSSKSVRWTKSLDSITQLQVMPVGSLGRASDGAGAASASDSDPSIATPGNHEPMTLAHDHDDVCGVGLWQQGLVVVGATRRLHVLQLSDGAFLYASDTVGDHDSNLAFGMASDSHRAMVFVKTECPIEGSAHFQVASRTTLQAFSWDESTQRLQERAMICMPWPTSSASHLAVVPAPLYRPNGSAACSFLVIASASQLHVYLLPDLVRVHSCEILSLIDEPEVVRDEEAVTSVDQFGSASKAEEGCTAVQCEGLASDPAGSALVVCDSVSGCVLFLPWPPKGMRVIE